MPVAVRGVSNAEVFRAGVRALASNSRAWSTFLKYEPTLTRLLLEYDPAGVKRAVETNRLGLPELKACLPGQTSTADARAILKWAEYLPGNSEYYPALVDLRHSFVEAGVADHELTPLVAGFLGKVTPRRRQRVPPPTGMASWKLPGMGPVLGSEFLRNLRWSGFKPDRHIKRLFLRWFPDVVETCLPRTYELAGLIGTAAADLREFLLFSLVGASVTPEGHTFTEVDNLVWALGAYVEKKGKESDARYRRG